MEWIQQIINGISLGSIYALIALGYTMVYGIIKLINFAHGDVFMVGSFIGFYAIAGWGLGFFPALLLSMAVCAVFGVLIERIAYKRLRNATRIAALITAIGVSLLIEYGVIYLRGAQPEAYPDVLSNKTFEVFGAQISSQSLLILSVSIILMIILQFIVHKTKIGKAMRAVSHDMEAARLMGINVDSTISATFAIGSALAGAAGVIFGVYYTKIEPLMGVIPGLKAFVAAVLGGIGIIPGAMVGGLVLGVVETVVSAFGYSLWRDAAAFIILILILIFRPSGIFGKNTREKVKVRQNMKKAKGFWVYVILSVIGYFVVQFLINSGMMNPYYSNTLINIAINIMLAVSLHLVIGITGQFSIGHAGFLAVGAYISAIVTMKLQLPFSLALVAGGIVAALAGLVVGIPSLRLKGDYLAIATLGFAEIIRIVFLNIEYVGGAAGMQVSHLTTWTYTFICLFITVLVITNFTNSRHGRACISIRENEIAADAMGINTTFYKVLAFAIGSFFAGVAGGLYSHNFYIIQPTHFGFLKSFDILIYVVLGGLGSLSGSVIAAILLTVISAFLQDYPETRMIIYSLVLVIVMLYRPQGLMGTREITDYFGKWKSVKGGN